MSEQYLSTWSLTRVRLKKSNVCPILRRPQPHFRHAQGHQRACAITGSINIFHSTNITVDEVEHQQTRVNTKLGKHYLTFRSNQRFSPIIPRKRGWKTQKSRNKSCIAFLKLIDRYYKILWRKSTSIFKEQTRKPLKLNIDKTWCRQTRTTNEQFLQISIHTDMKSTKEAIS